MVKVKDRRYVITGHLIRTKYFTLFREIFDLVPYTLIAKELRMGNDRFERKMQNVNELELREIYRIGQVLEVEEDEILQLVLRQRDADRKVKLPQTKTQTNPIKTANKRHR